MPEEEGGEGKVPEAGERVCIIAGGEWDNEGSNCPMLMVSAPASPPPEVNEVAEATDSANDS